MSFLSTHIDCKIIHSRSFQPSRQEMKNCEVLLTRSKTKIDKALIANANSLKFIATATSGLDHIDQDECKIGSIEVFNPVEANAISASEHTFALILSLTKSIAMANNLVLKNQWKTNLPRGTELSGKNLCIIGLGRVGSRVARMGRAFSMNVFAYDPYKPDDYFKKHEVSRCGLSEALSEADILSLHTPLTDETNNMLNRKNLSLCSPLCVIINTSRGPCLNQNDLVELLNNRLIAKAAIDVFQNEPLPESSPILACKNILLTPHIGAFTQEAFQRASMETVSWVCEKVNSPTL